MNKKPQSKARRNIAIVLIASILILIAGVLINNVSGSTKPIQDVADTIDTPPDWNLVVERLEPPRFVCLGDNACPSVYKKWDVDHDFSTRNFESFLKTNFQSYQFDEDCLDDSLTSGSFPLCSATSKVQNFEVNTTLWKNSSSTYSISISIK